jgi:hypothetical protein
MNYYIWPEIIVDESLVTYGHAIAIAESFSAACDAVIAQAKASTNREQLRITLQTSKCNVHKINQPIGFLYKGWG